MPSIGSEKVRQMGHAVIPKLDSPLRLRSRGPWYRTDGNLGFRNCLEMSGVLSRACRGQISCFSPAETQQRTVFHFRTTMVLPKSITQNLLYDTTMLQTQSGQRSELQLRTSPDMSRPVEPKKQLPRPPRCSPFARCSSSSSLAQSFGKDAPEWP